MSSGILILAGAELIFAGARRAWLRCGGYSVPAHIIDHCQEQGKRSCFLWRIRGGGSGLILCHGSGGRCLISLIFPLYCCAS